MGADHGPALAREGIGAGVRLVVEAVAPFGGPLIVRLGRARLALARIVARTIEVEVGSEVEAGSEVEVGAGPGIVRDGSAGATVAPRSAVPAKAGR